MKKEIGSFVVGDSTKCTGCKACELACFTVHNRKSNHLGKTVGTVTVPVTPRLFLTKFEQGCMPIQCKHCEDAPCLNACTKGAISRIDHQVIVDAENVSDVKTVCRPVLLGRSPFFLMPGTDVWWPRQCLRNQRFLHPNVISARELREVRPVSVSVLIRRSVW